MDAHPENLLSLSANVAAYLAARGGEAPALPAQADDRVRAYDARIAQRLQAGEQELLKGLTARGLTLRHNSELTFPHDLHRVTRFFLKFWRLGDYFAVDKFDPTVTFCESLEEFVAAEVDAVHLSDVLKQELSAKLKKTHELNARERGGGMRGMYAPGGIYINGWFFNYGQATPPRALLKNRDAFPGLLSTVIHEALGHGFFMNFSGVGQDLEAVNGQTLDYARRFDLRLSDSPRLALLGQRWFIAFGTSLILHEGWTMWLSSLLTLPLLGQPRRIRYTLAQLWKAVSLLPCETRYTAALQAALEQIFLTPPAIPQLLLPAVRVLESMVMDPMLRLPQQMEYVLGSLLFDRLEANVGLLNVPLAMLTAANLKYDLETISAIELHQLLRSEPRFNADWRLATLSGLELPAPVTWPALAQAAYNQLNLAVPPELA